MNQMKKIQNKYMREIRNLFPALRREEKKYLRKMEENIADYLENECPPAAVSSVEDLRQIFGDPREIVHQYYSTMEADAFYSFLRVRRLMGRVALFICGLVNHDLCFSSGDTIFSISKAGSGMIQLMYILAKIFLDGGGNSTVYLIDNPETHLHPDLQGCIVDAIMSYSDNQLIIATHAPEIIGALRDNMVNVSGTRHRK